MADWIIEQTVEMTRPTQPYTSMPVELMLPGDHLAHTWRIKCLERGLPADLTGFTASGYFKRKDGNYVLITGSISGNTVSVTLTQECYAYPGSLRGVVRIANSDTDAVITLADRLFFVQSAVDDGGTVDPGEVIPSLADLLAEIDVMETATAAAQAAAMLLAPDVDELKAQIDDLGTSVGALENTVPNKLNKPATDGTSGQLLRTNGDGTTVWVDEGLPTDEQTAEAVSAWLDTHPEATTTVEDGSITMPKLNSALEDVIVITAETEKGYGHNVTPKKVVVYPNDYTQDIPVRYAGSKCLADTSLSGTSTQSGITPTIDGRFVKLSGTGSGSYTVLNLTGDDLSAVAGKTVNICVYFKKATGWQNLAAYSYFIIYNGTTLARQYYSADPSSANYNKMLGWTVFENISIPANSTYLWLKFDSLNGVSFSAGDFIWVGIYESSPVITETIVTTAPEEISVSGLTYIDTMMHESVVSYIMPTKDYVDEHTPDIIGYWTDRVYALPEDFGAVGDGVTDDSSALADCFAYSASSGKPVRGYGKYKITTTAAINWRYADVYLRDVIYSGNGAAIDLQNMNIAFEFHSIQSSNVGINFGTNGASIPVYARWCQVKGNEINSTSHCIKIDDLTIYCTCDIRYLTTTDGDCIHRNKVSTWGGGEFIFRSSSCGCPNGYVSYDNGTCKFYDFTVEANCKYGYRNPSGCLLVGCRHREQTDGMKLNIIEQNANYNNGALIIFTQQPNGQGHDAFKCVLTDDIPWFSVDTSAVSNYDSISDIDEWHGLSYTGIDTGMTIRGDGAVQHTIFGSKTYFIGGHLVCVPEGRNVCTLSQSEYDLTLYDSASAEDIRSATSLDLSKAWATDFITGYTHTDVYLNASFGAIGYNDLTITQQNGYTCKFYDKLGNVLFDGTSAGNGKWSLKCYIDRSSVGRYEGSTNWWCYDGTNETWTVEEIS